MAEIKEYVLSKQDIKYRYFTLPLLPNIDKNKGAHKWENPFIKEHLFYLINNF